MSAVSRALVLAATLSTVAAVALHPLVSEAQSPANDLADLNYQSLDSAHRDLPRRGFIRQTSEGSKDNRYENWWNSSRNRCITLHAEGGKVASVVDTSAIDCGQTVSSPSGASSSGGGSNNAAAVAVGAAAILGIAALSHKSHHHNDNKHHDDDDREAEFERGYRDGLYNYPYTSNPHNGYSDGFSAGMRDREARTPYRGGYPSDSSNLDNLIGARAAGADSEMRARGYVDRGAKQHDGHSQVFWWNSSTRDCVRVSTANGRIDSIRGVDRDRCD